MFRSRFHSQLNGDAVINDGNAENGHIFSVGIIGAGPAGLISAKHAIASGYNVTIYEKSVDLGGTWLFTENVGKNKYGGNIHTAMYEGLRYNLIAWHCLNREIHPSNGCHLHFSISLSLSLFLFRLRSHLERTVHTSVCSFPALMVHSTMMTFHRTQIY